MFFAFQAAAPQAQAELAEAVNAFLPPRMPAAPAALQPPGAAAAPQPSGPSQFAPALLAHPATQNIAQALMAQRFSVAPAAPQRFAVGGMATSLREDPEYHDRDQDFVDTRNQQLLSLVRRPMGAGFAALTGDR